MGASRGSRGRVFSGLKAGRHRPVGVGVVVAAVAALLISMLALGADPHRASGRHSPPRGLPTATSTLSVQTRLPQAIVRIPAPGASISVPRSFLGISTEYWTIPVWANHLSLLGRVLSAITPHGPMVLRIGGSSADQAFWAPTTEPPEWVFEIRRSWLSQVSRIVNRFGVRVILDLNLVTATPQAAVRWARAAETALPAESVVGFEIGNESDIYSRASWQKLTGGGGSRTLPQRMTAAGYASSYLAYATPLARVDRGVALLGPALSEPATHLSWISGLLAGAHPRLGAITAHRYPLSACSHRGSKTFPTIARVLSENATAGMARTIRGAVQTARRAGLPVRLTEINSVTCGGRNGVSDTFATALWAPDALFELLRAGASSAAVHVRANAINMAFSLTRRGLAAYPLLYGLSLFSRTLGADPQLLPLRLNAQPSLRLKAWAVRTTGDILHILLIDKSTHAARVSLQIPGAGPVTAQRLLARSARSTSGITLGGQHLNARGRWAGEPTSETIRPGAGGYQVTVRGISATLVTATLNPGVTATHRR
jgi:hypothetical protein